MKDEEKDVWYPECSKPPCSLYGLTPPTSADLPSRSAVIRLLVEQGSADLSSDQLCSRADMTETHQELGDTVWVNAGSRTPVLEVTVLLHQNPTVQLKMDTTTYALSVHVTGNSDTCASVCNACRELGDRSGLVLACGISVSPDNPTRHPVVCSGRLTGQTVNVVVTVASDCLGLLCAELGNGVVDRSHALAGCSHLDGRVVAVAT